MTTPISVQLVTAPGCQKSVQAKQALAGAVEQPGVVVNMPMLAWPDGER